MGDSGADSVRSFSHRDENVADDFTEHERPPKRRRTSQAFKEKLGEFGLMRNGGSDNLVSFVGSASGIYFIRSVYGSLAAHRASQENSTTTPKSDVVPGEDDQLCSGTVDGSTYLWHPQEVITTAVDSRTDSLTFEALLGWTRSYFDTWHQPYPFLHAPSILDLFERLVESGQTGELESVQVTILRSLMSISLADRRQTHTHMPPVPADLVFDSYDASIRSIGEILVRPTSIETLQAVVSVQLFLVSMMRYSAASRLEGLTVRMAFQLGLHRCPFRYSAFSANDARLRQRLFWSIYCIDRYVCQSLGLPLAISDNDVDVCYPGKERHQSKSDGKAGEDHILGMSIRVLMKTARGGCQAGPVELPCTARPTSRSDHGATQQVCLIS